MRTRALLPLLLIGCGGSPGSGLFTLPDGAILDAELDAPAEATPAVDAAPPPPEDAGVDAAKPDAIAPVDAAPPDPLGAPCDPAKGNADCRIPSGVCIESHTPQYAVDMWHRCTLICSTPADKLACQSNLNGLCAGDGAPCLPAH